jgi:ATP-dependent DNA helicase RecQ
MAAYYPQSLTSLLTISGVGQVKLTQYGEAFLTVIQAYCEKHKLKEKTRDKEKRVRKSKKAKEEKNTIGLRFSVIGDAYNSGESLQSLMARFRVQPGTILDHLVQYVSDGNHLRLGNDLLALVASSPDEQQAAMKAFDELGPTRLKPVFDKLEGNVGYDDLKILRLIYLIQAV